MKLLIQITAVFVLVLASSMIHMIHAQRTVQMNILCSHMTSVEKARKVLNCFNIKAGSADEKKWDDCFTKVGIQTGLPCHERYFKTCELNNAKAKEFESCARPDRYENQRFRDCVDPI